MKLNKKQALIFAIVMGVLAVLGVLFLSTINNPWAIVGAGLFFVVAIIMAALLVTPDRSPVEVQERGLSSSQKSKLSDIKSFLSTFPHGAVIVFIVSFLAGFFLFMLSGEDPTQYEFAGPWGIAAICTSIAGPIAWAIFRKK